jgi:hypothetical protein
MYEAQSWSQVCVWISGFGGAEVACWPLIPKFAGSNPAEAVGFWKGNKNPHHAFLRKGSKIIGPMSQICGMLNNHGYISQASSGRHFRPWFFLWLLGDYCGLWMREAPGGRVGTIRNTGDGTINLWHQPQWLQCLQGATSAELDPNPNYYYYVYELLLVFDELWRSILSDSKEWTVLFIDSSVG